MNYSVKKKKCEIRKTVGSTGTKEKRCKEIKKLKKGKEKMA